AVVLAVEKSFRIRTDKLAAIVDVIKAVALHRGRRTDTLLGPVIDAAGGELIVDRLPQEFAIRLAEAHDDAFIQRLVPGLVDVAGIARLLVIGADKDLAAGNDRSAVSLRAQIDAPLDIFLAARLDAPFK